MGLAQKPGHFARISVPPKAREARFFLAPRTPLGVQRDVLETRKPAGLTGAEYGTSPGHCRNLRHVNHWLTLW